MSQTILSQCSGCQKLFNLKPGSSWCQECSTSVQALSLELSAPERKRLESQAIIRGCSVPEVIRQALVTLFGNTKYQRPVDASQLVKRPYRKAKDK